jgi:DNA-binding transcriptional ArsR family regulator
MRDVTRLLTTLTDPTRLRLLRLLRQQELCVC